MADIQFDTYYRYEELSAFLRQWADEYPNLCQISSLGRSYEGREIWLATLTNIETGPDTEKPAYWVDANIHATEVAPSAAALYLIHKLLGEYGRDETISYILDSRVFYIVPRLNPDGAEWALADKPRQIRSSTRPYPREDRLEGLHLEDVDGDGRLLQMRIRDPHGAWKPHLDEPRLLIRRDPADLPGGDYYRLLREGVVKDYDGVTIKVAPPFEGLDLNRNFPVNWLPSEKGAGPFPTSEPEVRAAVQFISDHPNITGAITFHTFAGVHLRPLTAGPDEQMPTQDLRTYQAIGRRGEEITGYPAISVYHDFRYDPKDNIKGTFDDWLYEHLGLYAWTTEIWAAHRQAGVDAANFIDWMREHPPEDDLKMIRWADKVIGADGYVDWYPFEHPQLGQVELGGWNIMYTWRNPPPQLLEQEIAPLADFAIFNCLISPRLEVYDLTVRKQEDVHAIRLVLHNTGWLPTNVSQQALDMEAVRPLEVDLELPEGASLLVGQARTEAGQLAGRDATGATSVWAGDATDERVKLEWVVQAPQGGEATITAVHRRAGTVRVKVDLS